MSGLRPTVRLGAMAVAMLAATAAAAQGDPVFSLQATPAGLAPGGFMAAPAAADLDGDGDVDVIVGDAAGAISYFDNTAGAGGTPAYTELLGAANPLAAAALGFAATVAIGDLDRDGDLDVLAGRGDGSFSYFQNTAGARVPPVFAAPVANPFGLGAVGTNSAPALADLDGDGDLDLIAGRTDGTIAYFENTAPPAAPPSFVLRAGVANPLAAVDVGWSSVPTAADPDGDGDLDVLVGDVLGNVWLSLNTAGPDAAPVFGAPTSNPWGLSDVGFTAVPTVADLDRDGDLDLLAGTSVGTVSYFLNGAPGPMAVTLQGAEGWRMLAAPIGATPLATFLGPLWTQGVPGADNPGGTPNVLRYDESVTTDTDGDGDHDEDDGFVPPPGMSEPSGAGRGMFVWVYEDDDMVTPGTQGGFPKTLSVTGAPRTTPFVWGATPADSDALLSYTPGGGVSHDGWNLLGNPFASWFDWDAADLEGMDGVVYVFDPAIAAYRTYSRGIGGSLPGGVVGAFQAFWVHVTSAARRLEAPPAPADGGPVYGLTTENVASLSLSLHPAGPGSGLPGELRADLLLALGAEQSAAGRDWRDAYALAPPAPSFLYLASEAVDEAGAPVHLVVDARPVPESRIEIDLAVAAVASGGPAAGDFVLRWPAPENVPADWTLRLLDRETGGESSLQQAGEYAFTLAGGRQAGQADQRRAPSRHHPVAPAGALAGMAGGARFAVVIEPGVVTGAPASPAPAGLSTIRPNPTSGGAAVTLTLTTPSDVLVEVLDALGRRIAVIAEGALAAGSHELLVDAGSLPPGAYLVRAVVGEYSRYVRRLAVAR